MALASCHYYQTGERGAPIRLFRDIPPLRERPGIRIFAVIAAYVAVVLTSIWAVMALAIDLPFPRLRIIAAAFYGLVILLLLLLWRRLLPCLLCFVVVLVWWLTLKPSNEGQWQPDVSRTAWAD